MFRSVSTQRGPVKYERLAEKASGGVPLNEELKRSASLPARASTFVDTLQRNPTKKVNMEKSHPLFSFLDFRRKKKTTARPELARYLEYVKEGGMWDFDSNKPVIYYK